MFSLKLLFSLLNSLTENIPTKVGCILQHLIIYMITNKGDNQRWMYIDNLYDYNQLNTSKHKTLERSVFICTIVTEEK